MSDDGFHDRFERDLNARVPGDIARSFTPEQLSALKSAFGGTKWDGHPVDLRGVIPIVNWYFAFVAGRDKRGNRRRGGLDDKPKSSILGRIFGALTMLVVLALLAVLLFS